MGWEQIKDYMNSLIGASLLLISIVLIPEIRAKKKYWITITTLVFLLAWLGVDKIKRDNKKEAEAVINDSTLRKNVSTLTNIIIKDSLEQKEFYKKLEDKFSIVRDSSTNTPLKITNYNTKIENARDVFIGAEK